MEKGYVLKRKTMMPPDYLEGLPGIFLLSFIKFPSRPFLRDLICTAKHPEVVSNILTAVQQSSKTFRI